MATPNLVNHNGLHRAALDGDDEAVHLALETGADINALDEEGRTPIMCAVAGDRWQEIDASDASFMTPQRLNAIRILLRHPQISLSCLNAPHAAANGVIPLSMAAWLNFPQIVELLLEESTSTVAVDGLDAHGATALMYAARDNSLQVVQLLLSHGARPDLRDCNFRSSVQYAIPHPQILWLCESVLRRHRWRESQSADTVKLSNNAGSGTTAVELLSLAQCALPSFNQAPSNTLIDPPPQSIFTSTSLARSIKTLVSTLSNPPDISFLRSILFSPALPADSRPSLYPLSVPVLVNKPDERGWSAIHHASSFTVLGSPSRSSSPDLKMPEIEILDILYLAGADLSLFTTEEHYTPLHILAKTSTAVPSKISPVVKEQIQDFVTHLVRDLGAPLGARDKNDETCLHMAAEYGASKVVLDILLDLDRVLNDGRVSKMKNARGLLACDLAAEPELQDSFAAMKEKMDMATIRRGSVSSALSDNTIRGSERRPSLTAVVDEFGVPQASVTADNELSGPLDVDPIEKTHALLAYMRATVPTQYTLDQIDATTAVLVSYFQARIDAARREIDVAKKRRETAGANLNVIISSLCSRGGNQACGNGEARLTVRGKKSWKNRESEDSQLTRVSSGSDIVLPLRRGGNAGHVDVATQTAVGIGRNEFGTVKATGWTEWFEGLIHADDGTVRKRKDKKDKAKIEAPCLDASMSVGEFGFVEKSVQKGDKGTVSGAHRLKNWWKKMIVAHDTLTIKPSSDKSASKEKLTSASTTKLELLYEIQDPLLCPVGHESRDRLAAHCISASFSSLALADDLDEAQTSSQTQALQQQAAMRLAVIAEREGEWTISRALRTAPAVLGAAKKDLGRIEMALRSADEYLKGAEASVERVGRVLKRALKKRRAIMEDLSRSRTSTPTPSSPRSVHTPERRPRAQECSPSTPSTPGSPGYLGYGLLSLQTSYSSISSVASDCSVLTTTTAKTSLSSITNDATILGHSTPRHHAHGRGHGVHDDDETRTMRRLLIRRIEAQLSAAYDEVDRVVNWISIVQDVVGGVKRRAYL
ncbi:hypothetical protein P691DRAFT_792388 [Macrolepiota fuliginosa MF-IS2]|uniref:protein S-acyltransferase n=1 Tax=Macrolepiota fuliginosa MF-IS2 TaxID=1400762 RepID=A0A9P6C2A3_9AGAR|nr:hypothetical protein P691DRAFT_792388 [Macrolepiota fuliginosa MF-IS2]